MKFITFIASISMIPTAMGAAYTVENSAIGFNEANGITDNLGNLLSGSAGSGAIGFFSSDSAVSSAISAANLLDSDWRQFGLSEDNFAPKASGVETEGMFSFQGVEVANLSDFENKNIYLVLGHGSSLGSSTEFLVYKFNTKFKTDETSGPVNEVLSLSVNAGGSLLIGKIGPAKKVSPFTALAQPTFQMATLVPEPSSTALLGLGTLALMFRRRR